MNPIFRRLLPILFFAAALGSAHADENLWIYLSVPDLVSCEFVSFPEQAKAELGVFVGKEPLAFSGQLVESQAPSRFARCESAVAQAVASGKRVFINLNTAEVVVDDGKFVRSPASAPRGSRLENPRDVLCYVSKDPALGVVVEVKNKRVASRSHTFLYQSFYHASRCWAAMVQAMQDETSVGIHPATSEVLPLRGYFVHP